VRRQQRLDELPQFIRHQRLGHHVLLDRPTALPANTKPPIMVQGVLLEALNELDDLCRGSLLPVNLKKQNGSDFIRFQKDRFGQVFVSGEIGPQKQQFEFRTEQDAIRPLIAELAAIHEA
jgi:hypothetical protein